MEIQEVLDYIEKTPANTNPNVLGTMLAELSSGGGAAMYAHNLQMKAGDSQSSEVGAKAFNFTFIVPSHDSTPATTLEGIMQLLGDYGTVAADGDYIVMTGDGPYTQQIVQLYGDSEDLRGTFAYFEKDELVNVGDENITSLWGLTSYLTITDSVVEI